MRTRRFLDVLTVALLACLMIGHGSAFAQGNGKKPPKDDGGGGGSVLPPVLYQTTFFASPSGLDVSSVYDVNDYREVVGAFRVDLDGDGNFDTDRAFYYMCDPLVSPGQAIDLNSIVTGIPEGYAIRKATAINEWGDIAAYLEPILSPGQNLQAAMIDMSNGSGSLHIIPDRGFTDFSVATDLSELGDLVVGYRRGDGTWGNYVYNFGAYDPTLATTPFDLGFNTGVWPVVNNMRQVAGELADGSAFRVVPGYMPETFPSLTKARSLNDGGQFCGGIEVNLNKSGSRTETRPYVMGTELEVFDYQAVALDLNEASDFVTNRADYNGGLFHRDWGQVDPVALLDPSDPDTAIWLECVQLYNLNVLTGREAPTDFPTLCGAGTLNGVRVGFVWTPIPAP